MAKHDQSILGVSAADRPAPSAVGRVSADVSHVVSGLSKVQATGRFLRRELWVWPLLAAVVFGAAGWWVNHVVETALRDQRAAELNAMVDASATAVRVWMGEQRINVNLTAQDEKLAPLVVSLLSLADGTPAAASQLVQALSQNALRARLAPKVRTCGYVGYIVVSPDGIVLSADQDAPIGKPMTEYRKDVFDQAVGGQTLVSSPYRSMFLLADEKGEPRPNLPTMFTVGPIRDERGKPIAALGLRIRPEDQFTRMLQVVRFGASGETYAFDRSGLLLSQSRFDEELKQIGLLVDQPDARSILTVELKDPQVNMAEGARPALRRSEQPLTRLAADAVQGKDGHDADGHRDYRGVPSVGAWRWLPEYDFGVATEVDVADAFQPVFFLRRILWSLIGILALGAGGMFVAMLYISRQHRALQHATLAARKLGQYTLEEKLGAGGMGTVYRARHALLRRPTAVKLLDPDRVTEAAVARFEREVQLTSALTHPNTVAVFDYGRTPEGIFYYAMEYLEGMNLDDLVQRFGPLGEDRLVYLLRQACGSLAEAHATGLVHRDVKPANIFLTVRGGLCDFVKVLDFGLAKPLDSQAQANVTSAGTLMGTPHYLAPEAVNHPETVDARADVYAVGAVGYFLLTGTPVFSGATVMEICMKHVRETPEPPSTRTGRPIDPELESLLLRCLAKDPAARPCNAGALLAELQTCRLSATWGAPEAAAWWRELGGAGRAVPYSAGPAPTENQKTPAPGATVVYREPPA